MDREDEDISNAGRRLRAESVMPVMDMDRTFPSSSSTDLSSVRYRMSAIDKVILVRPGCTRVIFVFDASNSNLARRRSINVANIETPAGSISGKTSSSGDVMKGSRPPGTLGSSAVEISE